MSNRIVEEVPTDAAGSGGAQEKLEKQARQLAYDVKYKVKQQMNRGTNLDPAAVKKAYLSFLGRATGTPAVKALAKKKLLGEEIIQEGSDTKYKIRVTDKQTGNKYVRMATRAKIAELRANKNIASVEMTGHGEPTSTYSSSSSKPKKDYDGDGKKESSSKEHAGVVHNAIQKKKGGKEDGQDTRTEEFITDAKKSDCGDKKIKELPSGKKNEVKIMPPLGEELKKDEKKEEEEDPRSMGTKYRNMKNRLRSMGLKLSYEPEGKLTEQAPDDPKQAQNEKQLDSKQKKADVIKRQVLLKKLQAVRAGGGSAITASYEPEGELVDEAQSSYDKARKAAARRAANRNAERRAGTRGGNMERETYTSEAGARMHYKGYRANANEEVEFELTEEFITERVDYAIEYFFNEGINEEGLDLIIEEVGIDEFTAFVIDGPEELNEDEAAYQKAKKKAISGSDRREREGKGEYSPKGSSSPYAKQGLGAKAKKKPKIGHTGTKVVAATKKAKKAQPAKPASKEGLGSKIRSAVSKGVERHKAATKKASGEIKKIAKTASDTAKQHAGHRKKFVSGLKATPKEKKIAGGVAKAVKKSLTREELELEAKVDTVRKLDDEGKEDARNYRKYGTKHNQFMQAVRRRQEHRSIRGDKKIKGAK